MNRRAMFNRRLFAAALAAPLFLSLAACGQGPAASAGDPPLAGSSIGGPFTLVDSTGKTVHWADFAGKYRVVYFGYTWCPDVCPTDMQRIALGMRRFAEAEPAKAKDVAVMFITVDPKRDTPAKVGEFVHAFSDDFIGLTGTPAQVEAAAEAFKVYYELGKPDADGNYLVNHSNGTYLMDRDGKPLALLPVDVADKGQAVAAELEKWIR